jgi:hypothetical protein
VSSALSTAGWAGVLASVSWLGLLAGPQTAPAVGYDWAAPLPIREESVQEMRQAAGPGAITQESAHFVVVRTAGTRPADELLRRLETVYQAHVQFIDELQVPAHPPRYKLEVYFFATYEELTTHLTALGEARADLLGCYEPAANRAAFFDFDAYPPLAAIRATVEQAEPGQRDKLRARLQRRQAVLLTSVIQHEAAHEIQHNVGLFPAAARVPRWLTEGLAMLLEAPGETSGSRPPLNSYRLFEFRKLYRDGRQTLGDVRRLLVDDDAWCGGKCYPLAWAIVRYLHDERPAGFVKLLRRIAEGELPRGAAERGAVLDELFGPVNELWIDRFYSATMQLPLDTSAFAE